MLSIAGGMCLTVVRAELYLAYCSVLVHITQMQSCLTCREGADNAAGLLQLTADTSSVC